MLKYGNREFNNLQQQVEANMQNIEDIIAGQTVLADYEIRIVGSVSDAEELPSPLTYQGEYGDIYAVGESSPYHLYVFAKVYENQNQPNWVDLGAILVQGPQGEQGEQGETGPQGPQGIAGADGLTTSVTVNGQTYTQSEGNITLPDYPADVAWGNITGTLSSQADLKSALDAKQDSIDDLSAIRSGAAAGATAVQPAAAASTYLAKADFEYTLTNTMEDSIDPIIAY